MKQQKVDRIFFLVFTLVSFTYLSIRAVLNGPLNDEAFTFFSYLHTGNFLPFSASTHLSANNHVVNNVFAWLSYKVFGVSEWSIRLPNLLVYPLYVWYIYKLSTLLSKSYLRWLLLLLLAGAHYYLEFFAYARGYGLGMAFLTGAIFHLIKADQLKAESQKHLNIGLFLITLATLSNLNLLISFLIWLLLAYKIFWFQKTKWTIVLLFSVISTSLTGFLVAWSLLLNSNDQLSFGKTSISESFNSLLQKFTDESQFDAAWIYLVLLGFVFLVGAFWLIKNKSLQISGLGSFYIFLVLNILGSIILHLLMGINYPLERTGFHWYFFFVGVIPFIINEFKAPLKPILSTIVFLAFTPVFAYSLKSLNFYYSVNAHWREQQISEDFLFIINSLNDQHDFPLSLYASDNFYTVNLAFKSLKHNTLVSYCNNAVPAKLISSADLLIMNTERFSEYLSTYEEIYYDKHSTMSLMRRKSLLTKVPLGDSLVTSSSPSDAAFTNLVDFTIPYHSTPIDYRLDFDIDLSSNAAPLISLITTEVRDINNNVIRYGQMHLDYLQTDFSEGYKHKLSAVYEQLPPETHSIKCYLWNIENQAFQLNSSQINLFTLKETGSTLE